MMLRTALMFGALALPVAAYAHHGWTSYDAKQVITIETTLTDLSWGNPHGAAKTRYKGKTWDVILAPVSRMEARGLTREMLGPRQKVTLVGYPRSDGTAEMRIENVTVNGKRVELR